MLTKAEAMGINTAQQRYLTLNCCREVERAKDYRSSTDRTVSNIMVRNRTLAAIASKEEDIGEFLKAFLTRRLETYTPDMLPTQDSTPEQILEIKAAVRQVWTECKSSVERFPTRGCKPNTMVDTAKSKKPALIDSSSESDRRFLTQWVRNR